MMTANNSCLPVEVRTAVYRRALAQGYLNACKTLGITVSATLDELQMTIALELEGFYVRRHGAEAGMEMACTMLGDMVEPDLLTAPPFTVVRWHRAISTPAKRWASPFRPRSTNYR